MATKIGYSLSEASYHGYSNVPYRLNKCWEISDNTEGGEVAQN